MASKKIKLLKDYEIHKGATKKKGTVLTCHSELATYLIENKIGKDATTAMEVFKKSIANLRKPFNEDPEKNNEGEKLTKDD